MLFIVVKTRHCSCSIHWMLVDWWESRSLFLDAVILNSLVSSCDLCSSRLSGRQVLWIHRLLCELLTDGWTSSALWCVSGEVSVVSLLRQLHDSTSEKKQSLNVEHSSTDQTYVYCVNIYALPDTTDFWVNEYWVLWKIWSLESVINVYIRVLSNIL